MLRYRRREPIDGVMEVDCPAKIPGDQADTRRLVLTARRRWSIGKHVFNDANTDTAVTISAAMPMICPDIAIERFQRLRQFHRVAHTVQEHAGLRRSPQRRSRTPFVARYRLKPAPRVALWRSHPARHPLRCVSRLSRGEAERSLTSDIQ